ncbi:RNA polymerase sigma-70 domain protein [mine drainage metagenome]|uniref:RNA polymerase sigma-70 domain protein n=1 Tax=mine drainage metagenome TaxID=410659 RepID=T1ATI7_9ZZZZ
MPRPNTLEEAAHLVLDLPTEERRVTATPPWLHDLFRAEYGALVRVATAILKDSHRAEDMAQEAFLALLRARRQPSQDAARAWLHVATAHLALNLLRSEQRRSARDVRVHLREQALSSPEDPLTHLERSDEAKALHSALLRLPRRSAVLLALRHGGRSYAEIAEALQMPISQIGTRLRRAEARLRKEFQHASSD